MRWWSVSQTQKWHKLQGVIVQDPFEGRYTHYSAYMLTIYNFLIAHTVILVCWYTLIYCMSVHPSSVALPEVCSIFSSLKGFIGESLQLEVCLLLFVPGGGAWARRGNMMICFYHQCRCSTLLFCTNRERCNMCDHRDQSYCRCPLIFIKKMFFTKISSFFFLFSSASSGCLATIHNLF